MKDRQGPLSSPSGPGGSLLRVTRSILFLGGTRSGKSALAESTALSMAGAAPVTYLATGPVGDDSMQERIAAHQVRRPAHWTTKEVGADLAPALRSTEALVLVDSLGTWVAAHHDFVLDIGELVAALADRSQAGHSTIVVSDEVGMGVHPATDLGQRFRDVLGEVNRAVSLSVDEAMLVVAGRTLRLDRPE